MRKKKQTDREKEEENRLKASINIFKPDVVKTLLVVEYDRKIVNNDSFYLVKPEGEEDVLFIETIKTLYPDEYSDPKTILADKLVLLNRLKNDGFYMIDGSKKKRQKKVVYPTIRRHVGEVAHKQNTLVIVVSTNHGKKIIEDLKKHGFNVINKETINFPHSPKAREAFRNSIQDLLTQFEVKIGKV